MNEKQYCPPMPELKELNDDAAMRLAIAVMHQAVKDLERNLYRYNTTRLRETKDKCAWEYTSCRRFILRNSEIYSGIDGKVIIDKVNKKVAKKLLENKNIVMEVP